mgnify:CR=1 FL=1
MIEGSYEKTFLGGCAGVGLKRRGNNDLHICFTVLVEDDGSWFIPSQGFSSYWLEDLQKVLIEAKTWMHRECKLDPTGGYCFKE